MSQRTVLVVLVAVLAAIILGALTYGHTHNTYAALIAAALAFGAALVGAHKLID